MQQGLKHYIADLNGQFANELSYQRARVRLHKPAYTWLLERNYLLTPVVLRLGEIATFNVFRGWLSVADIISEVQSYIAMPYVEEDVLVSLERMLEMVKLQKHFDKYLKPLGLKRQRITAIVDSNSPELVDCTGNLALSSNGRSYKYDFTHNNQLCSFNDLAAFTEYYIELGLVDPLVGNCMIAALRNKLQPHSAIVLSIASL